MPGLSHEIDEHVPDLDWFSNARHRKAREAERRGDALIAAGGVVGGIVAEARESEASIREDYARAVEWVGRHPGEEPSDETRDALRRGLLFFNVDADEIAADLAAMGAAIEAEARAKQYRDALKLFERAPAELLREAAEHRRKAEELAKPYLDAADKLDAELANLRHAIAQHAGQASVFSDFRNQHPRIAEVIPPHRSVLESDLPLKD